MINVNIGVLGHVDSGKTSLCRCLSEVLSTCALDKHKQSQERGITIDLGFSSFYIKKKNSNLDCNRSKKYDERESNDKKKSVPNNGELGGPFNRTESLSSLTWENEPEEETIQVCLVDCPGHHSLLKCIVMGAEITDMIFLVIDINKGIQKQTLECLVLCEIVKSDVIIVLNKIDLIPAREREKKIIIMKRKIEEALSKTCLRHLTYYIVSLSADTKKEDTASCKREEEGEEGEEENRKEHPCSLLKREDASSPFCDKKKDKLNTSRSTTSPIFSLGEEQIVKNGSKQTVLHKKEEAWKKKQKSTNINILVNLLRDVIKIPKRESSSFEEFYFLYDHTFDIKGKGTVYTGTVIKGMIKINHLITILPLNIQGKIKDIQSFKRKKKEGIKGDRLSLLISHNHEKNIKKVERGIIVHENTDIFHFSIFICKVKLVEFYKKNMNNAELLTCIIGFSSSLCYGYFFKKMCHQDCDGGANLKETDECLQTTTSSQFDRRGNYLLVDDHELSSLQRRGEQIGEAASNTGAEDGELFFLTVLKKKIYCFPNEKCIFLKSDDSLGCRICMHGEIIDIVNDRQRCNGGNGGNSSGCYGKGGLNPVHSRGGDPPFMVNRKPAMNEYECFKHFKILKEKEKVGFIERVLDNFTILGKNVFTSVSQITPYLHKKIYLVDAGYQEDKKSFRIKHVGCIAKAFAKSGKFVAQFDEDISHIKQKYKLYILLIKYYKDIFTKRKAKVAKETSAEGGFFLPSKFAPQENGVAVCHPARRLFAKASTDVSTSTCR
ncbi:selenocysteine-specific elongation factor selB homologue, putative [Plasmodium ovale wallikeri]|uniref:Selenocysteine-specific elongation factor selB homologue, putative n=1 Tax=Plasmodium ovale wallikeri TaxID=864142 RepID=A0A1A8YI53_PLAOA|nr:selenocysteine-specific elongation factor selB homologue, putative [Plasmodium ovale wallikeri]